MTLPRNANSNISRIKNTKLCLDTNRLHQRFMTVHDFLLKKWHCANEAEFQSKYIKQIQLTFKVFGSYIRITKSKSHLFKTDEPGLEKQSLANKLDTNTNSSALVSNTTQKYEKINTVLDKKTLSPQITILPHNCSSRSNNNNNPIRIPLSCWKQLHNTFESHITKIKHNPKRQNQLEKPKIEKTLIRA